MGVPPALPGRQQQFDISGSPSTRLQIREPPSTRKGIPSMDDYESLSHSKWECKYTLCSFPKCRRKTLAPSCVGTWAKCSEATGAVSATPSRFQRLTNSKPPLCAGGCLLYTFFEKLYYYD